MVRVGRRPEARERARRGIDSEAQDTTLDLVGRVEASPLTVHSQEAREATRLRVAHELKPRGLAVEAIHGDLSRFSSKGATAHVDERRLAHAHRASVPRRSTGSRAACGAPSSRASAGLGPSSPCRGRPTGFGCSSGP